MDSKSKLKLILLGIKGRITSHIATYHQRRFKKCVKDLEQINMQMRDIIMERGTP